MEAKEVIAEIREVIQEVKQNNNKTISIDKFISYLNAFDEDLDKLKIKNDNSEKLAQERTLAHYHAQNQWNLTEQVESFKAVLAHGQATLKGAMLINGAAAVALLAFIGNIWTKEVTKLVATSIAGSIGHFSYGVLFAVLGMAGSYFSQYFYHSDHLKTGIFFHIATVIVVIVSFILFGCGIYNIHTAFLDHFK